MKPHGIHERAFAAACYQVLMTKHNSVPAPSYLLEKLSMVDSGGEAFTFLDFENQQRVLAYCDKWNLPLPEFVQEYMRQVKEAFGEQTNQGGC